VHEEELAATLQEGARIEYLVSPVEFLADSVGRVNALVCLRNELGEPDASGRPRPIAIQGSEFRVPVDMVILALGQAPDAEGLGPEWQDLFWPVDPETMMTPLRGVFAGGDFASGPSTIIEAVRDGQAAAKAIDAYVSGSRTVGREPAGSVWPMEVVALAPNGKYVDSAARTNGQLSLDCEVAVSLALDEAVSEALRCLYCGLLPSIDFDECTLCQACVQVCPVNCLWVAAIDQETGIVRPATSFRESVSYEIDEDLCIRCGRCFKACPVGAIVVQT
jgi:ferredoxin